MQHPTLQVLVPFSLLLHNLKMPWGVYARLYARPREHNGFPTLLQEWTLQVFPGAVCTQGSNPASCVAELSRLKIPSVVLFQTEED